MGTIPLLYVILIEIGQLQTADLHMIKFIECLGDLEGMIECIPVLGIHFRGLVKYINVSAKVTTIKKLTNRIKHDWAMRIDEFEETILRSYAEQGRLLTVTYTVYMFSALAMFLAKPLIPIILDVVDPLNQTRVRDDLFQAEYFIDQDEIYFYIIIHAYVTMPIGIGIIIACDTMYAVYALHTCSIFATLSARLQKIGGIAKHNKLEMNEDPLKRMDEAFDDIVVCIKMHNDAAEIANLLESLCCTPFLIVLGVSILTTTVTGFRTVTNLDNPNEAVRSALFVIGELIHLFYIFWQGQMLMQHSQDVFINAYNVDWCNISPRARQLLVLIMIRSLKPCKLTAGKIFVLSMENYLAVLKTSISYFTVLLSMQ